MTVFHAYRASTSSSPSIPDWRVDWRGAESGRGNTARLVVRCPHNDDGSERTVPGVTIARMMAGYDLNNEANGYWAPDHHEGIRPFRDFISRLYQDGYFNSPGLAPIIPPGDQRALSVHNELIPSIDTDNQYVNPYAQPQYVGPASIWAQPRK
jgi:hypothetical protein